MKYICFLFDCSSVDRYFNNNTADGADVYGNSFDNDEQHLIVRVIVIADCHNDNDDVACDDE